MEKLTLSSAPQRKLESLAYNGQPVENYLYLNGYEGIISKIPNPFKVNPLEVDKAMSSIKKHMLSIAEKALAEVQPEVLPGKFKRSIIAVEEAEGEGQEVLFAHWGEGFSSPVHGHSEGLLYEFLVKGKILIDEWIISDLENRIVRPRRTFVQLPGEIVSKFTPVGTHKKWKRESFIHNFTAIEPSVSLHYVPEHARDGRDNTFVPEFFVPDVNEMTQIDSKEAMYSKVGDVILVRSQNISFYGDHYIIIIGRPVMKEHGLRPKDLSIRAGKEASDILDKFHPTNGVTLLRLSDEEKKKFLLFHKY